VPQLFAEVDRDKVLKQGIELSSVYQTLQAFLGGTFVNYFNRFGRVWQVYVQAEGDFRTRAETRRPVLCSQRQGRVGAALHACLDQAGERPGVHDPVQRVPRGADQWASRARVHHPAGDAGTRRGIRANHVARHGLRLLGMSFQEQVASQGVPASAVIGFSVLVVFLLMAALYESWTLRSPSCSPRHRMFGALGALWLRGFRARRLLADRNAHGDRPRGQERDPHRPSSPRSRTRGVCRSSTPALEGVRVRRRALFMTSFAFILGCVPLWTAAGAGAVGRRILGTVVIGGMLTDTLIASLFISVSFYVSDASCRSASGRRRRRRRLDPRGSLDTPVGMEGSDETLATPGPAGAGAHLRFDRKRSLT